MKRLPLAPEGFSIIAFVFVIFALSLLFESRLLSGILFVVFVFVLSFFRDPDREVLRKPDTIYSPADGKVMFTDVVEWEGKRYNRVAIFLSVFNCHVNRIPFAGKIVSTKHHSGDFFAAWRHDTDTRNERQDTVIETAKGQMRVIQITGAIARRIICHLIPGQSVESGERFGMIRFGSRTDLYFPLIAQAVVREGDKVTGGITPIARF